MNKPHPTSKKASDDPIRYLVLLGAIIVQLILGTVYGYSIFWEPLSANIFPPVITEAEKSERIGSGEDVSGYVVVTDEAAAKKEAALQQSYLKYSFSICILTFAGVMVIAGRVQDLMGPRFPAIIGGILMGSGFLIAGLMNNTIVFYLAHSVFAGVVTLLALMLLHALVGHLEHKSVIVRYAPFAIITSGAVAGVLLGGQYVGKLHELDRLFLLWGTVGFLAGAGIGFVYVCPIAALVKWFPNQKGLVSGLAVAGFGFGAYLFSQKWGALGFIREQGILPFFTVHGVVCIIAITIGALLLRNPPVTAPVAVKGSAGDLTWQQTLRRPAFYILWMMFFSGAMSGLMVIGIVKVFAGEQLAAAAVEAGRNLDDAGVAALMLKGAAAVGWLAVFNAIGRIVWGFVSDRIGRTSAFAAMFVLQAIMMLLLAGMNTELSLAVAASIVGFNFGGNFALFPSATADLFGAKNLGANYGWVFTAYGIAGVVGITAGNAAKVITGSYAASFTVASALCLISAALAVALRFIPNVPATTPATR